MARAISALPATALSELNALGSGDGPRLTSMLRLLRLRRPSRIADRKDRLRTTRQFRIENAFDPQRLWPSIEYI